MELDLNDLLGGQVFAFILIFSRIGAAMMLFPGIGESYVSARTRLIFALMLSAIIMPLVGDTLPKMPTQPAQVVMLLGVEVMVGLFFGTIIRMLLSALEVAGTIISMQIGLSNASIFNPALATQGTLTGAMLGAMAITIIFSTGLEVALLRGLVGTYEAFVPGAPIMLGDVQDVITKTVARSFALGAEMAAPFLIVGVLMSVAFGVISRLMPQIQIFTLTMSLQVGAGLALFALTLAGIMLYWLQQTGSTLQSLGWQ
jgi:flagellar biosynthesis protein FliR